MFGPEDIKDVKAAIRTLVLQSEALAQARKVTEFIAKNKDQIPPTTLERMKQKVQGLFKVIEGKAQSEESAKLGEKFDACKMLKSLAQNAGTDKPGTCEHGSTAGDASAQANSAK
ncbi:hypothetical protein WDW86_21850 [Bdellovibrionota bacterium FG-2]